MDKLMQQTVKKKYKKIKSPNNLPFLQSQILQKIYLDINNNKKSMIEEIAQITDYKKESKILSDAINALITKEFISGNFENGFIVPIHRKELYNLVVRKND